MAGTSSPEFSQPPLPDEFQPQDAVPADGTVECLADVPAEEWERHEATGQREGEPPDTEVDPEELV
jgi:hypothetical protein